MNNPTLTIKSHEDSKIYVILKLNPKNNLFWSKIEELFPEESQTDKIQTTFHNFFKEYRNIMYYATKHDVQISIDSEVEKQIKRSQENRVPDRVEKMDFKKIDLKLKNTVFSRDLKSHQKTNLEKIINLSGFALFSVPGAGKTTEALAYYYYHKKEDSKLLIISPKNAFPSWDEQLSECVPNQSIQITRLTKNTKQLLESNPRICISTYEKLNNDLDTISTWISQGNYNFIILDESHRIKGNESQRTKSALSISHIANRKIIMSGTPMPQEEKDLCPQLEFLYKNSSAKDGEEAKKLMESIFVRTSKEDLNLPPYKIRRINIPLSKEQKEIENFIKSGKILETGYSTRAISILRRNTMKLLQFASNPSLLLNEDTKNINELKNLLENATRPKIEYACEKAKNLIQKENKQVLIWSIFKENIEYIKNKLDYLGSEFIHGGVTVGNENDSSTRENRIKRFKEGDIKVLVANPASCAESISLHTVCHDSIYIDRSFNLAHYLQSLDRIHRLGLQPNIKTNIEILICKETIDETVNLRLEDKKEKMENFLNKKSIQITSNDYKINDLSYEEREKQISKEDDIEYAHDFDQKDAEHTRNFINEKYRNE